jgi:hypothetical protein
MAEIFDSAKRTQVMFKVGVFGKTKYPKMVNAPFACVMTPSSEDSVVNFYLETIGFSAEGVANSSEAEELAMARTGMSWFSGTDAMVLDQSQMGDLSDNWVGLNYFSLI